MSKMCNCWIFTSLLLRVELSYSKVLLTLLLPSVVLFTSQCTVLSDSPSVAITTSYVDRPVGWVHQTEEQKWCRGDPASSWLGCTRNRSAPLCFMGPSRSVKTVGSSCLNLLSSSSGQAAPRKSNDSRKVTLTLVCLPDHTFAVSCKIRGPRSPLSPLGLCPFHPSSCRFARGSYCRLAQDGGFKWIS